MLVGCGHKTSLKKDAAISFLGTEMLVPAGSLQGEWELRLTARCTELAVSYGHLPRLPWETVLFGVDKKLPRLPKHIHLPDDMLILGGREDVPSGVA